MCINKPGACEYYDCVITLTYPLTVNAHYMWRTMTDSGAQATYCKVIDHMPTAHIVGAFHRRVKHYQLG